MTATVHRITAAVLSGNGHPPLLVNECAQLPCGCCVYVGRRIDNREPATGASACAPEHQRLIEHFNLLLRESLADPLPVALADVCASLLCEAERNYAGRPA